LDRKPLGIQRLKDKPTEQETHEYIRSIADALVRMSKETLTLPTVTDYGEDIEAIKTENAETQVTLTSLQDQIDNLRGRIEALEG
jgi:TolA-binding protein